MSNTHAPFSPSSADRWLKCPRSVALTKELHSLPDDHSIYTASGTVIHAMGEALLRQPECVRLIVGIPWGNWATVAPFNDELVDQGMIDMAIAYSDAVDDLREPDDNILVEVKSVWSDKLFGTADCVLIDDDRVTVIDLKTGAGNLVSPVVNRQLMTYAGMVLAGMDKLDVWTKVRLVIIQPPDEDDPVKIWDTNSIIIGAHMAEVELAMESDAMEAGEHCRWCPVAPSCPIKHEIAVNAAALSLDGLSPEKWAQALNWAELLGPWIKSVNARATQLAAEAGLDIPGYKLVNKTGNLAWNNNAKAENELVNAIPDRPGLAYNDPKLRTPTQLKKELKDYGVSALIDDLSSRPDRGVALVKESDSREPIETGENLIAAAEQLKLFVQ